MIIQFSNMEVTDDFEKIGFGGVRGSRMIGIGSREHGKKNTGGCSFDDYFYKEKPRNGMEAGQASVVREGAFTHKRNDSIFTY